MLEDFARLRITRHPMRPYLGRVIELRDNLTAYDAFYVALAETLVPATGFRQEVLGFYEHGSRILPPLVVIMQKAKTLFSAFA